MNLDLAYDGGNIRHSHCSFPFKKNLFPFSFGDACNAFINYGDDGGDEKISLPFVSPNIND